LVRALECRSTIYLHNKEYTLAVGAAREATTIEPFRESAYRCLMVAAARAGNTAEAVKAYEECRQLLRDELGVAPSAQTRETLEAILQTGRR
jgi:DNA-binding SARP family transcriptional activator